MSLAGLAPVGLAELDARASLQHRYDVKYVLSLPQLDDVLAALAGSHRRLEIDGVSHFGYRSLYVDTAGLACLQAHRQGRRLRFKARTRCYDEAGLYRFELKLKDGRGATVKHVMAAAAGDFGELTAAAEGFASSVLAAAGIGLPGPLVPALLVSHQRATLMEASGRARLTIDTGLRFGLPGAASPTGRMRAGRALLETKSAAGRSAADLLLRSMGVRPETVSKYCIGVCLTRPGVPDQPWRPLLARHFSAGPVPQQR